MREAGKSISGIFACIANAQQGKESLYASLKGNVVFISEDKFTALRTENERLKAENESLLWWKDHSQKLRNAIADNLTDKCGDEDLITTPIEAKKLIESLKTDKRELVETLEKCCESFRDNLSKYAYKNEPSMLSALNKAQAAVAKHREK